MTSATAPKALSPRSSARRTFCTSCMRSSRVLRARTILRNGCWRTALSTASPVGKTTGKTRVRLAKNLHPDWLPPAINPNLMKTPQA